MNRSKIRPIAVTGIMSGLSFVLMWLEFPIPFIIPSFIQFDFSELPSLITSFAFGPTHGVLVCLVKNILHLSLSKTSGVGELANFILGAVFCYVAGIIYKNKKTFKRAVIGCLAGAFLMAIFSLPINYFITYPFYFNFMPKQAIISMYSAIYDKADTLLKALVIFNIPFTFIKGLIDSAFCFAVYKKLSPILKNNKDKK
ncbi:MAG: ECF transporter S component [Clostridia bacterium]|nr:ECF transporter S component [Clostridia bacterium]